MLKRWRFAWPLIVGALLVAGPYIFPVGVTTIAVATMPACATLPPTTDRDGDGVPDAIDQCPDEPGPWENLGCPLPVAGPYDCANPPAYRGLVAVSNPIKDRFVVVLKKTEGARAAVDVQSFAAKLRGVTQVQALVGAFGATIESRSLRAVLSDPAVAYVQQEGTKRVIQWGLDRSDQRALPLDGKYNPDGDCAGVHAFVIDTGCPTDSDLTKCSQTHPDFGTRYAAECHSQITLGGCSDQHGHATHVAGTIGGTRFGICKGVTMHGERVLDKDGSGTDTQVIAGVNNVTAFKRAHPELQVVANMSLGGSPAPALDQAVCDSIAAGVSYGIAAGNESQDAYNSSPARVVQGVTVGAIDKNDSQADFSNFGEGLDVYGPGVDIESDRPDGGTATMSGTSMATPHVVGGLAMLAAKNPSDTPQQLRDKLVANATKDALKNVGAGSPNALLFVGKEGDGDLPPKGEPVGPERLLRPNGTRLRTNDGQPFEAVMAVPCCMTFMPRETDLDPVPPFPRPAPFRVAGVDTPTLWPLASEAWQQYTEAKGAANMFHFRLGPFYADKDTEVEWEKWGGPYLTPGGEFNPAFWQRARELVWNAYLDGAYVEIVPIDTWGCKHSQGGSRYVPWPKAAIDACGRTWHPEHERYARKVVEEFGCFGNVVWALDNEGQNIQGWQGSWFLKLRDVIRDEEQKSGCGFVHMIGTSVGDVQTKVDYSITHVRAPLTAPIAGRWTLNNERNPSYTPAEEERIFANARKLGLGWAMWRDGMNDDQFEDTLARFKRIAEGGEPPPPPECDVASIPTGAVVVDSKTYGKGFDSTMKVKNAAWCAAHGMASWGATCPMAPEGDACRNVRERYVLAPHVCPRFVFLSCNPVGNPGACPGTFKVRIGDNLHPINQGAGCPNTVHENEEVVEAFWAQPSGRGVVAACLWRNDANGKPLGCGKTQPVDQAIP